MTDEQVQVVHYVGSSVVLHVRSNATSKTLFYEISKTIGSDLGQGRDNGMATKMKSIKIWLEEKQK